jgi:hypothetical protein
MRDVTCDMSLAALWLSVYTAVATAGSVVAALVFSIHAALCSAHHTIDVPTQCSNIGNIC